MINIIFFKLNTILILYLRQLKLQSQKNGQMARSRFLQREGISNRFK